MRRILSVFFLVGLNNFSVFANETTGSEASLNSQVTFLENKGQWNSKILYQGNSMSTHVSLLRDGISFGQLGDEVEDADGHESNSVLIWNLRFVNPSKKLTVTGANGKPSVISYLYGSDSSDWIVHPAEYKVIKYNNIYQNVDLHFYGSGNDLKYDYVVKPGGNVNEIAAQYEGIQHLQVNMSGELEVTTIWNTQIQRTPVAWQIINNQKKFVTVNYRVIDDSTFGFIAINGYDHNYDLIIDPLFQMVWSSYTNIPGGNNNINYCFSNAMDNDGNVYLTGMVDGTFPITPGAYSGPGNVYPEVFVAKFASDGTTLIYWTYLPGSSSEFGNGIAVDDAGRAYVTGDVSLNITGLTNFPSTANAFQPVHNAGTDAFLTVLNPSGSSLVYSTFLGGTGSENSYGIALGDPGIAYITGYTSIGNFPVKASSAFPTGDNDLFVAKFDINQSGNNSLIYSTRIGGGSFTNCHGRSIAVNSAGNVFITGKIFSSFGTPTFPITPGAYNSTFNTGMDGVMSFVTKLSATTPVTLSYSTYLAPGTGSAIAIDPVTEDAFVVGSAFTFAFPVTPGALQPVHAGNNGTDAFAIRLNAAGNALVYSTFLGGYWGDVGTGVAVNSIGEAYVVGITQDSFPTSPGGYQPDNAGTYDFFVVNLNATGTGYGCGGSTYVGGSDADYSGSFYDVPAPHVSLRDHSGNNDTILVSATSHSQDFPTTPGVYGPVKVNGISDQPVFFKMTCASSVVAPVTAFTANVITTCGSALVNLNDLSTNNPASWQWSFPGGSPSTSGVQNPQGIVYTASGNYNITLVSCNSAGCDSITIPVQITIPQNIMVSLGNDTTVCSGNNVLLTAVPGFANYSWQLNGNAVGGNTVSYTATQSGIYSVLVSDTSGCTGTDTVVVFISNPSISIGSDIVLCNNDSVAVTATTGFSDYLWFLNGALLPNTGNLIVVNQPGTYLLNVTDSLGCSAADTMEVTSSAISIGLISDTSFCAGNNVLIDAGPGYATYEWKLNGNIISATSSITVNQSGNYLLLVTNAAGCDAADSVLVTVFPLPIVQTVNDTVICDGSTVLLVTTGAISYQWSPATYLSSPIISNPVSTPASDILYTVTGTDNNGCVNTDVVSVQVLEVPVAGFDYTLQFNCNGIEMATENLSSNATQYLWNFGDGTVSNEANPVHYYSSLQNQTVQLISFHGSCTDTAVATNISFQIPALTDIPNVFTPNDDGKNDCFKVPDISNLSGCFNFMVFNRWGTLVFDTDKAGICWNGLSNSNSDLPAGVYFYLITIGNTNYNGPVHLLR